jgi:hypothetical protein
VHAVRMDLGIGNLDLIALGGIDPGWQTHASNFTVAACSEIEVYRCQYIYF